MSRVSGFSLAEFKKDEEPKKVINLDRTKIGQDILDIFNEISKEKKESLAQATNILRDANFNKPFEISNLLPTNVIDFTKIDNVDKYPFGKAYVDDESRFISTEKVTKFLAYKDIKLEKERKVKFEKCLDNSLNSITLKNTKQCFMPNCTGIIHKKTNTWYGYCDTCKAIGYFFTPTPMQQHFINNYEEDELVNVGAFGSGKTVASAAKVAAHMILIPNAYVLALAQTLDQLKAVAKPELMKFIPQTIIEKENETELVLKNGSKIEWIASDNENKLRGRNATMAWVVEFNEVKAEIIDQLEKRVRSQNAFVYEYDKNGEMVFEKQDNGQLAPKVIANYCQIILETNPDPASKSLQIAWKRSTHFISTKNVRNNLDYEKYLLPRVRGTKSVCTYSTSTVDNPFISEAYRKSNEAFTGEVYQLFVKVDLAVEEGLVYQNFNKAVLDENLFPKKLEIGGHINWPRIYGMDFGGNNAPTTAVAGAVYIPEKESITPPDVARIPNVDASRPILFIYKDYRKVSSAISEHIPYLNKLLYGNPNPVGSGKHVTPWPVIGFMADPSGVRKNEGSGVSVMEQYRSYGFPLEPAYNTKQGSVADMGGLAICNDLFGVQVFISSDCADLIREGRNLHYAYKIPKGMDSEGIMPNKYETGSRDDVLDAMRYAIVEFYFWLKDRDDLVKFSSNQQSSSNKYNPTGVIKNDDGTWIIETNHPEQGNVVQRYEPENNSDRIIVNMPKVDLNK